MKREENLDFCEYLQQQLKENRRQAVIYMPERIGTLLDDDFFLNWLANSVGYKPYSLKNLITVKTPISRKNYHVKHREVYDFWLQNSITSNDSGIQDELFEIAQRYHRPSGPRGTKNPKKRIYS